MNVLAVERRDEALVQFGDDRVGGLVALVLDGLDLLDAHVEVAEGSARMLRSSLAPSVRSVESSAKSSKNLVSRGMRRICKSYSGIPGLTKYGKAGSRVISHAQWGVGKRRRGSTALSCNQEPWQFALGQGCFDFA